MIDGGLEALYGADTGTCERCLEIRVDIVFSYLV